jgi:hypothetical protein
MRGLGSPLIVHCGEEWGRAPLIVQGSEDQ